MDENRRRTSRIRASRRVAQAKADGKQPVAWILPLSDLEIVDAIKEANAFPNRAAAVSRVLDVVRSNPRLRKELGL